MTNVLKIATNLPKIVIIVTKPLKTVTDFLKMIFNERFLGSSQKMAHPPPLGLRMIVHLYQADKALGWLEKGPGAFRHISDWISRQDFAGCALHPETFPHQPAYIILPSAKASCDRQEQRKMRSAEGPPWLIFGSPQLPELQQ